MNDYISITAESCRIYSNIGNRLEMKTLEGNNHPPPHSPAVPIQFRLEWRTTNDRAIFYSLKWLNFVVHKSSLENVEVFDHYDTNYPRQ